MKNRAATTLRDALGIDPIDDGAINELTEEYLQMVHGGGTPSTPPEPPKQPQPQPQPGPPIGITGIGVPAPVQVANEQMVHAAKEATYYAETALYYGRHAAAEAADFIRDPIDYTIDHVRDWVRPDGPPPQRR